MAEIVLDHVTKRFPDGALAVDDVNLDDRRRRVRDPGRPVGLRQVDDAQHDRRARGHLRRRASHRRRGGKPEVAPRPRHRHGLPELRPLPAHDRAREHGLLAEAGEGRPEDHRRAGQLGRRNPRPDRPSRAQARPALGRPAPAGGDGARHRAHAERVPHGRAALEPGRQAARADAHRGVPAPEAARHDDRVRDARPGRGDDPRRPGRRHARRRDQPGGPARGALQPAGQPLRGRVHRLAGDELPARDGQGRHGELTARRPAPAGRAPAPPRVRRRRRAPGHHRHPPGAPRGRFPRRRQA